MVRVIVLGGLCLAAAGCGTSPPHNAADVYEALLRENLPGHGDGSGIYVLVDGADPATELLDRLRLQWPALRPASEAPKGKRHIVHVEDLKWLGRGTAEARGGFSNGMDGVIKRFRLIWTGGRWVVEKTTTEVIS